MNEKFVNFFLSTLKLKVVKREYYLLQNKALSEEESIELKRIKKVQSLCKGWLYRKRFTNYDPFQKLLFYLKY